MLLYDIVCNITRAHLSWRLKTMKTIEIDGRIYYGTNEVASEVGVSRQTLWRWRRSNRIPHGSKFRGRDVVFTAEEFEAIKAFANRLEPAVSASGVQLSLFTERTR